MRIRAILAMSVAMLLALLPAGCAGQPPTVPKSVRPAQAATQPARRSPNTAAIWGAGPAYDAKPNRSVPKFAAKDASAVDGAGGRNPRELPMFDGHTGQAINWNDLMRRISAADVIILGEQHDDAMAHAVQLAVVQSTAERWPNSGMLSMEMLERDEQLMVDDYLEGLVDAEAFARLTDSVAWAGEGSWAKWYQPIIDAAALHGWGVIAANAPRRYVRIARTDGYDRLKDLPAERQAFVAIPVTWPMDYRQRFIDVMNGAGDDDEDEDEAAAPATAPAGAPAAATEPESATTAPASSRPASPHGPMKPEDIDPGFRGQLLWDATMGDSIARALRTPRTKKVIHLVGQFHSDFSGGTLKEVRARRPIARVLTVSMQRADGAFLRERDDGRADVVIYTGRRPPVATTAPVQ